MATAISNCFGDLRILKRLQSYFHHDNSEKNKDRPIEGKASYRWIGFNTYVIT